MTGYSVCRRAATGIWIASTFFFLLFFFFFIIFFFLFRETETEKEYRVTEFENKIARNGGFGVKRYEIEGTENRFFDSINEKA